MPMSPRLLRPRASGLVLPSDADARAYVLAVNTADGQPLEAPVVQAIDAFVIGCKADGIWSAMKSACILAGARTISGALIPLVGTAPTPNNLASGDYSRGGSQPGIKGNGSNKWITVNRANNADPQDNMHAYIRVTQAPTVFVRVPFGSGAFVFNSRGVYVNATNDHRFFANSAVAQDASPYSIVGGLGFSRSSSSSFTRFAYGASASVTSASGTPVSTGLAVLSAVPSGSTHSDCRVSFYSFGESLGVALLDARVGTLMSALSGVA